MSLAKINLKDILFIDVETVPIYQDFENMPPEMRVLWEKKSAYQRKEVSAKDFYEKAGIWAEFGKIICISAGFFTFVNKERRFRVTSLSGDEKLILSDFKNLLNQRFGSPSQLLCGHNAKEFDFPYIARRMIINAIDIPEKLNLFGKKPWEINHLDTMELWRFGDYKSFTSLDLLTQILQIPSPKDDIDGSMVRDIFYNDADIGRIESYCEKDVISVAQILLRFRNESLLLSDEIIHVKH